MMLHPHLPLDARVFSAFRRLEYPAAGRVLEILGDKSAYAITFQDYENIQSLLWDLIADLNARPAAEVQIESRIELNLLWL